MSTPASVARRPEALEDNRTGLSRDQASGNLLQ